MAVHKVLVLVAKLDDVLTHDCFALAAPLGICHRVVRRIGTEFYVLADGLVAALDRSVVFQEVRANGSLPRKLFHHCAEPLGIFSHFHLAIMANFPTTTQRENHHQQDCNDPFHC